MFNIVCAIMKYRLRLESFEESDLLFHALKSQQNLTHNSYKTFTFDKLSEQLLSMFNMCSLPKFDHNQIKSSVNALMVPISKICKDICIYKCWNQILLL